MILTILTRVIFGFTLVGFIGLGVYLFYEYQDGIMPSDTPAKQKKDEPISLQPFNILSSSSPKQKKPIKPISYLEIKKARQEKALKIIFFILSIVLVYFVVRKIQSLKKN